MVSKLSTQTFCRSNGSRLFFIILLFCVPLLQARQHGGPHGVGRAAGVRRAAPLGQAHSRGPPAPPTRLWQVNLRLHTCVHSLGNDGPTTNSSMNHKDQVWRKPVASTELENPPTRWYRLTGNPFFKQPAAGAVLEISVLLKDTPTFTRQRPGIKPMSYSHRLIWLSITCLHFRSHALILFIIVFWITPNIRNECEGASECDKCWFAMLCYFLHFVYAVAFSKSCRQSWELFLFSVFYRYEELRYWYDCLFYEEELRQYHDYIAAIEEIESRQYHQVCFPTC